MIWSIYQFKTDLEQAQYVMHRMFYFERYCNIYYKSSISLKGFEALWLNFHTSLQTFDDCTGEKTEFQLSPVGN